MLLKKKYCLLWFVLEIITCNLSVFILGKLLNVYESDAWYKRWYYWVLGLFAGILPVLIMLFIFNIEITVKVCKKLNVPGYEIYAYPYIWIVTLIIPIIGWTIFIVLMIYTRLWYIVKLFQKEGEKFISVKGI